LRVGVAGLLAPHAGHALGAAVDLVDPRPGVRAARKKRRRRRARRDRRASSGRPGATPVHGYHVVASYPHDPEAFTQGLAYVDGTLYEGTGLAGASSIRRVDLETGEVLQVRALAASHFGEGIAVVGGRLFQLTWRNRVCFAYDPATFDLLQTFAYQGEGWGLASDGSRLIMSDGTSRLTFRDPATFAELGGVAVRDGDAAVADLNELEWVAGEIWANVWRTDRIARIDPATGRVRGWVDLTGLLPEADREGRRVDVLNGIAFDAATGRLFVTGKLWPKLFEIALAPPRDG
jgi:glutamine cyclotransferase